MRNVVQSKKLKTQFVIIRSFLETFQKSSSCNVTAQKLSNKRSGLGVFLFQGVFPVIIKTCSIYNSLTDVALQQLIIF